MPLDAHYGGSYHLQFLLGIVPGHRLRVDGGVEDAGGRPGGWVWDIFSGGTESVIVVVVVQEQ